MVEMAFECIKCIGYLTVIFVSIIGIRFLFYFYSFFFRWPRYRQLRQITTNDIRALPDIPFVKIQITTRGLPDSLEVIRRGIQNITALAREAPDLYGARLSIEVVTESREQKELLEQDFAKTSIPVQGFMIVVPPEYETPKGTKLKARSLHYMVELRRQGFNRQPGRAFIVHYDEESVMEPDELRKLIHYLATTTKQLSEGPIYYPLEYRDASMICRAMEAHRPIGCFECRMVMERGKPLHLHGSNLVVDEELENEVGWDIGTLDGQPLVAEDYVFGVRAYLQKGPQIFGWHGSIMLEQPPFSLKSAFKQRYRWIAGVLQGITLMQQMPEFHLLPRSMRFHLVWATKYRILTFALGLPTGVISLFYLHYQLVLALSGHNFLPLQLPLPLPVMFWLVFVSFLWLNSMLIGAWYNLSHAGQMSSRQRWIEGVRVLTIAPLAGILESSAGFWAVLQWLVGNRKVSWQPTPKTKQAEEIAHRNGWVKHKHDLSEMAQLLKYTAGAVVVMTLYIIIPLILLLSLIFPYNWNRWLVAFEIVALGEFVVFNILLKTTPKHGSRTLRHESQGVIQKAAVFTFTTRQVSLRYASVVLVLGISLQWLLLSWSSPWAISAAFQQASATYQACIPGRTARDIIESSSRKQQLGFQTGVIFPQWGPTAYSTKDKYWQVGLYEIQEQTGAQWLGVPINLYQPSLVSTQVQTTQITPTPEAVAEGIRAARAMHYHVFVIPHLTVGGPRPWAGEIQFPTPQLTQAWFDSYWLTYKPYVIAASQAGAEELAIGTEYELLQPASPALWNHLIMRIHEVFHHKLTYTMNWSSLAYPTPSWMQNPYLSAIGVSEYIPLTNVPKRLDPKILPGLWKEKVKTVLDALAMQLGKPVLISEIGYRDSADALYNTWELTTNTEPDPVEQAAAYNAALVNVVGDQHIAGIFAWAWSFPAFDLRCQLATQVLHRWYTAQT